MTQNERSQQSAQSSYGWLPGVGNESARTAIGASAPASTTSGTMRPSRFVQAYAARAIARNAPASGLDNEHSTAQIVAATGCLRCKAYTAASPNATPSPNVTRPTMRFVTVPTANHIAPTSDTRPNAKRAQRSNRTAAATPLTAPSTTGPVIAARIGERTLYASVA